MLFVMLKGPLGSRNVPVVILPSVSIIKVSPPLRVAAERSSEMYPRPTALRNSTRSAISRTTRPATFSSRSVNFSLLTACEARASGSATKSAMDMPLIFTARLSGRSRLPSHAGQQVADM